MYEIRPATTRGPRTSHKGWALYHNGAYAIFSTDPNVLMCAVAIANQDGPQ